MSSSDVTLKSYLLRLKVTSLKKNVVDLVALWVRERRTCGIKKKDDFHSALTVLISRWSLLRCH